MGGARRSASDLELFTADTIELTGDVRLVAVDGEKSWLDGGFGKLRSGSDGERLRVQPQLGNVSLVWKPQFTWSLSRDRRRLAPGRPAHPGGPQPGVSDLQADALQQASPSPPAPG